MSALLDWLLKPPRARLGAVMVVVAMLRAWPHDNANLAKYRAGVKLSLTRSSGLPLESSSIIWVTSTRRFMPSPARIGLRTQDLRTLLTVRANARRVNGLVSITAFWLSPLEAAERSVYPVI
jgi:hypothetical protein